uniref:DUF3987 domain-containing protein n=1 Tax=Toxocara canis TaxID=6265 RepID=A0A183VGV4_TOXCA
LVGVFAAREYRLENNLRRESVKLNAFRRQSMYRPAAETMQGAELLLHVYRQMAERFAITEKAEEVLGIPLGLISSDSSPLDAKSLALFARIYLNCTGSHVVFFFSLQPINRLK